jgi:lysozyme
MNGIDVSENNGTIDWQAVADAGIEFAIVRCSYGKSGRDEMFQQNVEAAHAAGLKVGAYHYSYALTPEDATIEAANCHAAIEESGVGLELPVWFDMEDADHWKAEHGFDFSADNVTQICQAFIDSIGYDCGVYASLSWLQTPIDWRGIGCAVWNAQWGADDDIKGMMWQYTDSLDIAGKSFDGDILY